MTDVAETLRRLAEEESRRAREATVAETLQRLQGQPASEAPTGGVTANPEAVADLRDNRIPAAAVGFADTATFGTSDELAGLFAGGLIPGYGYAEARDDARATQADMQERAGGSYLAGQIGGGLTTGLAVAGPVDDFLRGVRGLGGSGILPRMGRGAAAGAGEGLVYGLGSGEGTRDRVAQALTYGGVGGAIGGVLPPVSELAHYLALRPIGAATGIGNQTRAGNRVARAVEESGMSLDDIDQGIVAAADDGQPMFTVADTLGRPGRNALAGVTTQPGPGRSFAEQVLDSRSADNTARLQGFVSEAFDAQSATARQQTAQQITSRADDAGVNYATARASAGPVNLNSAIDEVDSLLGRNPLLGQESDLASSALGQRLAQFRRRMATDANQLVGFDDVVQLRTDLRLWREQNPRAAAMTNDLYDALTDALRQSSPDFRAANDAYRAASNEIRAGAAGQAASRPGGRAADAVDQYRSMRTPEERDAFRLAFADRNLARIENEPGNRNLARTLYGGENPGIGTRQTFEAFANDPEQLLRQVAREDTMARTSERALGGSPTAANLAEQAAADGADVGVMQSLLSGNYGSAGAQVVGRTLNAVGGSNEATREMIARALLSSNPGDLQRLLSSSQRNQSLNRIVAAMVRGGLREPIGGPVSQAVAPR